MPVVAMTGRATGGSKGKYISTPVVVMTGIATGGLNG